MKYGRWHLGCTLEGFHVHSYQEQFIQPSWAECVFKYIFSLGLCFASLFVLFDLFVFLICFLFVCVPILLCFLGLLSHLPYSSWR